MKLTIPYNATSFLTNLSTFGWKGSFKIVENTGGNGNGNANATDIVSESIITVKDYLTKHKHMSYDLVEQMILHLGNQMMLMSDNNLGLLFFNLNSVLLLDDAYFLIADLTNVVPMNSREQLTLNYPLKMEGLLSPELEHVTALPVIVSITSSYYSLGLLCVACLGLGLANDTIIDTMFDTIIDTKMYFFLQRCLQSDPDKRYFLYI
jgi:hypothetical protein